MLTQTAKEMRNKNPWSAEHFNMTQQGICTRAFPDLAKELSENAEKAEAARKALQNDAAACWSGLIRCYPSRRAEIEALRKRIEKV